ncbi:exodeoxyribonuclease VII small subunit [Paraliobacillus sediminis]|uniref:exodeoxyribonuclease VII small subunit n=1 Tax=Paraliobacillus sediminis TaxID=1885916 RepID=UPI000E3CE602|nr:exodeoxyribonuclease VII small subunit [Paraliobacillus sediminis]
MTDKDKEVSFEQAMEDLEAIVEKLEEGEVPLEKAIQYYQQGMELSKVCSVKLTNVEKQMTNIINEQGDLKAFSVQEEE